MPNRKVLVDEKTYRFFKGSSWPEFDDFIENNYQVDTQIANEIDQFISVMQEKYNNIATPKTIELSLANKKDKIKYFLINNTKEVNVAYPGKLWALTIMAMPIFVRVLLGFLYL